MATTEKLPRGSKSEGEDRLAGTQATTRRHANLRPTNDILADMTIRNAKLLAEVEWLRESLREILAMTTRGDVAHTIADLALTIKSQTPEGPGRALMVGNNSSLARWCVLAVAGSAYFLKDQPTYLWLVFGALSVITITTVIGNLIYAHYHPDHALMEAIVEINHLRARITELESALMPFALAGRETLATADGSYPFTDYRNAIAALKL